MEFNLNGATANRCDALNEAMNALITSAFDVTKKEEYVLALSVIFGVTESLIYSGAVVGMIDPLPTIQSCCDQMKSSISESILLKSIETEGAV